MENTDTRTTSSSCGPKGRRKVGDQAAQYSKHVKTGLGYNRSQLYWLQEHWCSMWGRIHTHRVIYLPADGNPPQPTCCREIWGGKWSGPTWAYTFEWIFCHLWVKPSNSSCAGHAANWLHCQNHLRGSPARGGRHSLSSKWIWAKPPQEPHKAACSRHYK